MLPFTQSEMIQTFREFHSQCDEIQNNTDTVANMCKSAYADPFSEKSHSFLKCLSMRTTAMMYDISGAWNNHDSIDIELFTYMAADISASEITPTSKLTLWLLNQARLFSRSILRVLIRFSSKLIGFLKLMQETYPEFAASEDTSPHTLNVIGTLKLEKVTSTHTLCLSILHYCISPRYKRFYQSLFDAHLFTDLPIDAFTYDTTYEILTLYGHSEGFQLKIKNNFAFKKLLTKLMTAINSFPNENRMQVGRWFLYIHKNTSIRQITFPQLKKFLKRMERNYAKWHRKILRGIDMKNMDVNMAKTTLIPMPLKMFLEPGGLSEEFAKEVRLEKEEIFQVKCSNPFCKEMEFENARFLKCARCYFERYCSRNCQEIHWGDHKRYCSKIRKLLQ